ncbi:MAG: hypothetical protein IPI96_15505 [Saprospiraceae bacterium]|nr:hypothetical protein [Saprospiraceae bacterium]
MTQYQMDMGAGFHRTFAQIFTSLSACFSLLCLFGSMLLVAFTVTPPRQKMS